MQNWAYLGSLETEEEIIAGLYHSRGPVAIDLETVSLKDKTPIGIGLQCSDTDRYYFRLFPEPTRYMPIILGILQDKSRRKIYHNAKFDLEVIQDYSPDDVGIDDTYLMARCLGLEAGLEHIGKTLLGFTDMFSIPDLLDETARLLGEPRSKITMLDVPFAKTALKCMNDVRATWFAYQRFNGLIDENYEVDRELISVLKTMERKGLGLDQDLLSEKQAYYSNLVDEYSGYCLGVGFNPGSPQQVAHYLVSQGYQLKTTYSGKNLSVDEEALEALDCEEAKWVLEYRKARKLLGTYIKPWLGSSRAYSHFRHDLSTGRLASNDRNLQNIPPDMRDIFKADGGTWTWMDYSQIEMRLFAYMSNEGVMLDAFERGDDVHWITQSTLWPGSDRDDKHRRTIAKTFNFALIFLAQAGTLAGQTKLPYQTASQYRSKWLGLYPNGHRWMIEQTQRKEPFAITAFGRRLRLPDGPTESHIQKCRVNYPIQGTAADIIKRAMLRCRSVVDGINPDLRVQVHDELVFDGFIPDGVFGKLGLDRIMEDYKTPYEVERGEKWK